MNDFELHQYDSAQSFAEEAFGFLEEHEAAHNIFFGVTDDAMRYPRRYPGDNFFATVQLDGQIELALMQTPPHMLIVSQSASPGPVEYGAREIARAGRAIPGILSAPEQAQTFIDAYAEATGTGMQPGSRQRIYRCTAVEPPSGVRGAFRRAQHDDLDVLVDWVVAFEREAMDRDEPGLRAEVANKVSDFVRDGAVGVWVVEGEVASMAAARGPTPNGIRISYVYTPPSQRGNGFASACVAELTQLEFDAGRDFCFLFTDLDNPTSNHIYQQIGYEPVCDMNVYEAVQ